MAMSSGDEPVTKRDLAELETRLLDRVSGMIHDSETRLLDRVSEMIHDSETRLLRAIFNLTERYDKRTTALEKGDSLLVERLALIETRLLEIEKQLHLPPGAA